MCVCLPPLLNALTLSVANLDIYQSAASWLYPGSVGVLVVVVVVFCPAAA